MPDPEQRGRTYVEPQRMDEAQAQLSEVTSEVQDIQTQLGDRNRLKDGERMTDHEFWNWRNSAKTALNKRLQIQRQLKDWIREHTEPGKKTGETSFSLITYRVDQPDGFVSYRSEAIDQSPISWLADVTTQVKPRYYIIYSIRISEEDYHKYKDAIA